MREASGWNKEESESGSSGRLATIKVKIKIRLGFMIKENRGMLLYYNFQEKPSSCRKAFTLQTFNK